MPLGIAATSSTSDAAIQKKDFESGMTTLITSNEEINDITRILEPLEESTKKTKKQKRTKKEYFFGMLLGTIGAILFGNLLTDKGTIRTSEGAIKCLDKVRLELVKEQLELFKIFNAASSFNKFWNTKVLSKWTLT